MAGSLSLEQKGDKAFLVAPSLLSADLLHLMDHIRSLEGEEDWLHVDIMDGHFVPNLSYGPNLVEALRKHLGNAFLDVHLMVDHPEAFIDPFVEAGADLLVVHAEASPHLHRLIQRIRESGRRPGVALNPATPWELLGPILPLVDLVLVMSVNPGFGGQKFLPEVLPKVEGLFRWRLVNEADFLIEVDGGISEKNAADLVRKGCDVLVAGNAVFKDSNPAEAVRRIRAAAEQGRVSRCE